MVPVSALLRFASSISGREDPPSCYTASELLVAIRRMIREGDLISYFVDGREYVAIQSARASFENKRDTV